jgi:hypothetical protein
MLLEERDTATEHAALWPELARSGVYGRATGYKPPDGSNFEPRGVLGNENTPKMWTGVHLGCSSIAKVDRS